MSNEEQKTEEFLKGCSFGVTAVTEILDNILDEREFDVDKDRLFKRISEELQKVKL